MASRLKRLESALVAIESAVLVALLSFMVLTAFLQVAARQLFHTGLLWGDTLLRHLVLWVGFLGAALASADEKHFAWDTFVSILTGRKKAAALVVAHLAAASITACLIRASWDFLMDEKAGAKPLFSVGSWDVPEWYFAVIVPVGFGLVLVHCLIKAGREAAAGWSAAP